jgi:multidrug efflux pump subunit AcrA (membrane-fusion protein)
MSETNRPNRFPSLFRSRRWLVVPPTVIGLAVIITLATSKEELPRKGAEQIAIPVRVIEARHTPIAPTAVGYGTAQAKRVWVAIAEVGGRVVELHQPLRSGIFVARDSLLAKIDPTDYELLRTQRDAELKQAQAELRQLMLNEESDRESLKIQQDLKDLRNAEVDRLKVLSRASAASSSEFDAALSLYLTQAQAVQNLQSGLSLYESRKLAADARIESAKAKLAEIERDLKRTEIRAPIAGLISQVRLEVGQYVSPREVLFNLLDVSSVEIEAQFSLAQLLRLFPREGSSPEVLGVSGSGTQELSAMLSARAIVRSGDSVLEYPAVPIRVGDQVDVRTRTLGIVVEVDNPAFTLEGQAQNSMSIALRPGTFCEVVLESKDHVDGVLVQRTAIDGDAVYVVEQVEGKDSGSQTGASRGRIRRRQVETWNIAGSRVVVRRGLKDGDLVIVNPPLAPADGLLVSPILDTAVLPNEPISPSSDGGPDDGKDVQR